MSHPRSYLSVLVPALAVLAATPAVAMDANDVQIHGFVSQGYLKTTDNNVYSTTTTAGGTFDFNEVGVNFTATPIDRLRVGVQIFAQNVGKYGEGKPQIDWAYGEYELPTGKNDYTASISAGRVKTSHGLYNDYRDLDMTRTNVFLPDSVYSTTYRDFSIAVNGAELNGTVNAGAFGSFHANAYIGGQNVAADSAIADRYNEAATVSSVDNITVQRADGGGLEWTTPLEGLRFKGSVIHVTHMIADVTTASGTILAEPVPGLTLNTTNPESWKIDLTNYINWIVGGEYQVGNFTFASEYSNAFYQVDIDVPAYAYTASPLLGGPGTTAPIHQHISNRTQGAYLNGSYRFHPKWEASLMGTWSYSKNYDGTGDSVSDFKRAGIVALRFDPTEHWLIKAEFQRNCGTLGLYSPENPNGKSEYWNLFALKTTFDF
jgi:hypothetical protein